MSAGPTGAAPTMTHSTLSNSCLLYSLELLISAMRGGTKWSEVGLWDRTDDRNNFGSNLGRQSV